MTYNTSRFQADSACQSDRSFSIEDDVDKLKLSCHLFALLGVVPILRENYYLMA
ncbi:hypothetical protein H6F50_22595 [Coleofasciculus sp. FACHB-712]|uniref:hypothetical protein n=1 Tax=Coleofasciculus sp. FACHB-712 TaxID=2692789 RepID=UPI0016878354|nr:hypothetical protein [Coleofasciculus sp. FACHB-712]MBD1945105.1 hypothetical protein [Coleofasciculus sp. FACHB-712]